MSSDKVEISKENIDKYLNELSKEYKKLAGRHIPAEIILIGGAAIAENYGFRNSTTDIDAIIFAASAMKEAILKVCDKFKELPSDWLNADFKKTKSFSNKLVQHSIFYKNFNQILDVRIVVGEYLVAMKLCSGRRYKHDLSDIVGIIKEHNDAGNPITYAGIDATIKELYGSWDNVSEHAQKTLFEALKCNNNEELYVAVDNNEKQIAKDLKEFREENPDESKGKKAEELIDIILNKKRNNNKK